MSPTLARLYRALPLDQVVTSNIYLYRLVRALAQRWDRLLPHEPDFAAFGLFPARAGIFLDIGANDGIAARSFRVFNRVTPILAIEPNHCHEAELARCRRTIPPFDYRLVGAGDRDITIQLYTPVYRGVPLTSYASFSPAEARKNLRTYLHFPGLAKRVTFIETSVAIMALDQFDLHAAFVKLDIEGYELPALRGLRQTIARWHPVIMVERNPSNDQEVAAFLSDYEYRAYAYDQRSGQLRRHHGQPALNLFYLHAGAHP